MIRFLLATAARNLKRNRLFSFINISGLAVAIACCVLIGLFIQDELSFDRQNRDADRIHRIATNFLNTDGVVVPDATTPPEIADHLKAALPEIESVTRLFARSGMKASLVRVGKNQFLEDKWLHTDSCFFEIFTTTILKGDARTALKDPNSIVLTETAARKYFGEKDPLGQTMEIDDFDPMTVTAVVRDPPLTAHFTYSLLIPRIRSSDFQNPNSSWDWFAFQTYIKVKPGVNIAAVDRKINELVERNIVNKRHRFFTQPLTSIHLDSNLRNELSPNSARSYLYILAAIGILILFIACINYINLSTAQSALRAKEIGIRKVNGAGRGALRNQFLTETLLTALIATLAGLLITAFLLPSLNTLTGKSLSLWPGNSPVMILRVLSFGICIGFLTGLYPALYLSSFRPAFILKTGMLPGGNGGSLRKTLVVAQFALAMMLMVGTFILRQQVQYAQNQRLGLNKENVLLVQAPFLIPAEEIAVVKESLLRIPGVVRVAGVNGGIPGRTWDGQMRYSEGMVRQMIHSIGIDTDYLACMNIPLVEGRNFFREKGDPDHPEIIFNERAIAQLGIPSPAIGRKIIVGYNPKTDVRRYATIVGVVKDFHFSSMKNEIEPFSFFRIGIARSDLAIRIEGAHTAATIAAIEKLWTSQVHSWPFAFEFLADDFARLYDAEKRFTRLFALGCLIAILVSCLGLFGLSTFMIGQRRKEIGVRKVLGGSVLGIARTLSEDFARLVLLSAAIGLPIAGLIMYRWLNGYAYRTRLHWWTFFLSLLISLSIALLTVGFQALRAARQNPIKALRSD